MSDQPDDTARKATNKRQLIKLITITAAISLPLLAGWIFGRNTDAPPDLCGMLRDGWTVDELADSDEWRDWPSSMSRYERGMTVLHEADNHGCMDLTTR